jgi:hypothetical protein
LFDNGTAAARANLDALASDFEKLQVWFLAAWYFDIRVTHMIGSNSAFGAQGAGH